MRILLFLLLAVVHYGDRRLAALFGGTAVDWFYALQGFGAMVLALLVALALKDRLARCLALGFAFEEAQVGTCGYLSIGNMPVVGEFSGLCGDEWFWLGLGILFVLAVMLLDSWRNNEPDG